MSQLNLILFLAYSLTPFGDKRGCFFQVPFFSYDEEMASTPKADALFLPRENPRSLVIRPAEQWPSKSSAEKAFPFKDASPIHENGKLFHFSL